MTNRFYVEGERRAERVGQLFGAIASKYDLLNDIQSLGLHRFWKRRLIHLSGLRSGMCALDLCCGTGDIAFRMAALRVHVTGLDFSEPMLAVARQRVAKIEKSKGGDANDLETESMVMPSFIRGDAMQLPFSDNQFDAVTVGYGLRNLSDWRGGLSEMVRVLKPSGKALVLDFGKPPNGLVRWFYFTYLKVMVPCFGFAFCGNASAYAYILESLRRYPAQQGVAEEMNRLGLKDAEVYNLFGGMMSINVGVKP